MDIKNKLKLIIAIDILAAGILSILLNEWGLCLIPLFVALMVWFLVTGENKTEKTYKLTILAGIGFIEGCLVSLDVVYNSIDIHTTIIVIIAILMFSGGLYGSGYIPKSQVVEDEFMEHILEKSGYFAFTSTICLMLTIVLFLFILYANNNMTYSFFDVMGYTVELMLFAVFNFAMYRGYLFKKYLS
ncbi:hypothetical protein [Methanococcus aeolicus]|uniref:hypothetical protein n=1 Tax=Methanococcus aeolicus TaxID=42879 RepID=UPI0021C64DF9|nr:hypothetical protein [Methanococcus aeolicus]UXM84784.1 hypothetical protein N6C89_00345 [Methanococcus aeolicus]